MVSVTSSGNYGNVSLACDCGKISILHFWCSKDNPFSVEFTFLVSGSKCIYSLYIDN